MSFDVACSTQHAFDVWTSGIGTWWPPDHTVSGRADRIVLQNQVGGRIYERSSDGAEYDWGEVTVWRPPVQLSYLWHLGRDRGDATVATALVPYSWSTSNMIADVQNWLDTPSSNNGWLLKNTDETSATDFRAFWSAQGAAAYLAANPTNPLVVSAPELIVSYTPVPEPKSLLVLAVTGLYTLTRRRKVCRV